MNSLFKKLPFAVVLVRFIRRIFGITTEELSRNFYMSQRDSLIKTYFANNEIKRLHIGCQANPLVSWLNVDVYPLQHDIVIMDATKPFCFENETFDYIFTEHMFEHITFEEGSFMLAECNRVLKKGGKIRLSTPDLRFLVKLYISPKEDVHSRYLEFSSRYFPNKNIPMFPSVVVNNFFRDWGHRFIHDRESIGYLLTKNGFSAISFEEVGKSRFLEFTNLERHGNEVSEEFNLLESLVVEAEK